MSSQADTVRDLTRLQDQVAQLQRLARPYTAVRARVVGTTQLIASSTTTATVVQFLDARWDTAGMWDASDPDRLTCQVAGLYALGAHIRWSTSPTGVRRVSLVLNGVTTIAMLKLPGISGESSVMSLATHYELTASDYVQVQVRQNSGAAITIEVADAYSPEFWATRIV